MVKEAVAICAIGVLFWGGVYVSSQMQGPFKYCYKTDDQFVICKLEEKSNGYHIWNLIIPNQ